MINLTPSIFLVLSGFLQTELTACADKSLRELEPETTYSDHSALVQKIRFSTDGNYIGSAALDETVFIRNLKTGKVVHKLSGHEKGATAVDFSHDSSVVATGGGLDNTVYLWEMATGKQIGKLGHKGAIRDLRFAPNDLSLAVGGEGRYIADDNDYLGELIIWNVATKEPIHTLQGFSGPVTCVAYSPDGRTLAAGDFTSRTRFWSTDKGKVIGELKGHEDQVTCIAFFANGKRIASGSLDYTLRLWDYSDRRELGLIKGPRHHVYTLAISPDAKYLAAAGQDGILRIWELSKGFTEVVAMKIGAPNYAVAFSPSSPTIAVACGFKVQIWNLEKLIRKDE